MMCSTSPLITRADVESQPNVLAGLAETLKRYPLLAKLAPERPSLFVGEGSSYNACAWVLPELRQRFPDRRIRLCYPWELLRDLQRGLAFEGGPPFLVALSQSGRTASLIEAVEAAKTVWPEDLEGLLLTNANPASLDAETWAPLQPLFLDVGKESGIAATKTFSAKVVALFQLTLPEKADALLETLPKAVRHFAETLPQNPDWPALLEAFSAMEEHPLVVIGHAGVMPLLPEVHLKLTETLSRPVLCYHHEGFKHGPRSVLHGARSHWPQLLYVVPQNAEMAHAFYRDAEIHVQHLQSRQAMPLRHTWVLREGTPPPPQNLLKLGKSTRLTLPDELPEDWSLLLLTQHLALALVETLGLKADGLTKYVANPFDAAAPPDA